MAGGLTSPPCRTIRHMRIMFVMRSSHSQVMPKSASTFQMAYVVSGMLIPGITIMDAMKNGATGTNIVAGNMSTLMIVTKETTN